LAEPGANVRTAFIFALLCLLAFPLYAQEEALRERAQRLLQRVEQRPDRAWDYAFALRNLAEGQGGDALIAMIEGGLESRNEHVRLICAQLTLALGRAELAYEALGDLLSSDDSDVIEAVATLITREGPDDDELLERMRIRWEEAENLAPGARVALSEALLATTRDELALEQLREFLSSSDHELMGRAALVLSERGYANEVGGRISTLARESGDIGRLARIGTEINRAEQATEDHRAGRIRRRERLIEAEIRAIRSHYVDDYLVYRDKQQELSVSNLIDAAARAMAQATDRYGAYLTRAEIDEMLQDQEGRYPGIGAHVSQDDEGFIYVVQPIYEGPAFAAGIRTGDRLVGVLGPDGNRIDLTNATTSDGVRHVRGPEGSVATVFVKRRGVDEELKFEIPRKIVHVNTALEEMLPGDIGYVRLTRFGANSDKDMKAALESLRRQGMKYLVLDLRDNPGGQLSAVLNIADMFLPRGAIIASTIGRFGEYKGQQEPFRSNGGEFNQIPMVCLINGDSSSGSEMLSGALKDNNRAVVIGRPTFGKDLGQSFYPVDNTGNSRVLKCTVFSYLLPSGTSIGRFGGNGGVTPHIETRPRLLQPWQVYALNHLRRSKKLEDYLDQHYRGEQRLEMMKLAAFDGLDESLWPGFDEFYASLDTRLARNDIRRELRFALRARVQDDRGQEFRQNFQEDPTLLRGITELLTRAGKDHKEISEYKAVLD
jgi:carboxyl-terminal processing protease